jgi:proteasome accessory factor B
VDRLERLVNLVAALLDTRRPLTRLELGERLPDAYPTDDNAFRRAFERDKEVLRHMGIPLVLEPIHPDRPEDGEGYRIPRERYELPDPGLDADELAALHLAASAVQLSGEWGQTAATGAIWKLGGAPADDSSANNTAVALPGSEHLAALFAAAAERSQVRFRYKGEDRLVDPYRLSFRNGHWYLAGRDHGRDEERSYRLDRLESPPESASQAGAFARPAPASVAPAPPWRMGDEEEVQARVLVDASQAPWAVAEVGPESVEETRGDGSVVLSFRVTNRNAFRTFVLGFLDHAEVVGPPELRRDMVAWLESVAG